MPAAKPRPESAVSARLAASPAAAPGRRESTPSAAPTARLADDLAVPAPSPVHKLQAGLVHLTTPAAPQAEPLYPGWFRLGFPLGASVLLWAGILWGASRFL
ncbi:hypothetical protein [Novosphingobium sp.]|uniref:hypothetical protein n=1 Tax=Novosphingobium sp. TaxID=1874826 RepID=UPI002628C9DD|nr:hypothetical protein [Novosphingobium sp.]